MWSGWVAVWLGNCVVTSKVTLWLGCCVNRLLCDSVAVWLGSYMVGLLCG